MYQLLVDYLSKADIMKEKKKVSENVVNYLTQEGNGLLEVVYMEPLCEELGITINELLSGEHLRISELLYKLDMSRLEIMKQIEYEQLKFRIFRIYGMEIESMEIADNMRCRFN